MAARNVYMPAGASNGVRPIQSERPAYPMQRQPSAAQQTGAAAGNIGGFVAGHEMANALVPTESVSSAVPAATDIFAPAAGTAVGGGTIVVPAGSAVPAGFEAVGTAANGGTLATPVTTGSTLSAAAPYLGAAGAAAGAYGLYEGIKNDDPGVGAMGGAGLGAGLAAAAPLLGFTPVGLPAILGAGLLGAGGGAGLTALFGHTSPYQTQRKRENKLAGDNPYYEQALAVMRANQQAGKEGNYKGQVYSGASKDFVGEVAPGEWVNNKFAESGDVADLRGKDIWLTPDFFKQYDDWAQKSEAEKLKIAQQALDSGAVSSRDGGIYVDFSKMGTTSESPATKAVGLVTPAKSSALAPKRYSLGQGG